MQQQQQQPMNFEAWKRATLKFSKMTNDPQLRALLRRGHAGCLVGFGGQTAQKIQSTFNVKLQFWGVENAKWGRVVEMKGAPRGTSQAWYECAISLLKNYPDNYREFGFSVDFIFPSELIDLFILQNDFQRIATASYTKILVKHNCLMRSTERVVRVHTQDLSPASLQCFQKFVYLITDLVRENNTLYLCASGNVYYIEHAEDDIQGYIRHNTGNDLVFFPEQKSPNQSDSTTTTSSTTTATNTKDTAKREEEEEEEASERWTSRDDVRDSECGNSSYYDATSEKGDFEDEEEETMDATDN